MEVVITVRLDNISMDQQVQTHRASLTLKRDRHRCEPILYAHKLEHFVEALFHGLESQFDGLESLVDGLKSLHQLLLIHFLFGQEI